MVGEIDHSAGSEVRLVVRVAQGDSSALAELYDRYASTLLGLAMRILRDRALAEDTVHDVFVSLHERARTYDPSRGLVVAWLVTMTRNLAIDRLRKVGRRRKIDKALAADEVAPPAEFLDARQVRTALANLPADQAAVVEAAFFEGLTYSEIAERDGVALGTVKSRAARAFSALKAALGGSETTPETYTDRVSPKGSP